MMPEREAELRAIAIQWGPDLLELLDTITSQRREIEALYGLLIEKGGGVFAVDLPCGHYAGGEWIGPSGENRAFWTFRSDAEARAAVRKACGLENQ